MRHFQFIAAPVLAFTLAACAPAPVQPRPAERPFEDTRPAAAPVCVNDHRTNSEWLAYARRIGELSAEGQKKEYAAASQALARNKNDIAARMRSALFAALPSSRYRDNNRALVLLEDLLRDKNVGGDVKSLATLLKESVTERQKSEDNAVRLTQKARDEQSRADALQQKLDEIRNIEKALIERNQNQKK
jgi:hypothetical protein